MSQMEQNEQKKPTKIWACSSALFSRPDLTETVASYGFCECPVSTVEVNTKTLSLCSTAYLREDM